MKTSLCLYGCLLGLLPGFAVGAEPEPRVRQAIERGLRRLEEGASSYITHRQCFSCHHQTVSIAAMMAGKSRGFKIADEKLEEQVEFTAETFRPRLDRLRKGQGVPGASTMTAYALFTLEIAGYSSDKTTEALVEYLLVKQRADGAWPALAQRPPSEGSLFVNAALALRALRHYGKARSDERVKKAMAQGRKWLLEHEPKTMEDRTGHLRGLVEIKASKERIEAVKKALLSEQKDDGSWAQLPDLKGDAYATATVLLALREAGVKPGAAAFQRGVSYLLGSQQKDGSWIVKTRSRPVQVFFDNGDPGGKSQFISFMATGWATLVLLETLDVP